MLLRCILTMPCSGTAAWTLRLTTWAKAGQCWGGLKPLLGSVALVLLVGTLAGCPLVSYTFMCSRLPCLAALCQIKKKWWLVSTFSQRSCCFCYPKSDALFHSKTWLLNYPDAATHQLYSAQTHWFTHSCTRAIRFFRILKLVMKRADYIICCSNIVILKNNKCFPLPDSSYMYRLQATWWYLPLRERKGLLQPKYPFLKSWNTC